MRFDYDKGAFLIEEVVGYQITYESDYPDDWPYHVHLKTGSVIYLTKSQFDSFKPLWEAHTDPISDSPVDPINTPHVSVPGWYSDGVLCRLPATPLELNSFVKSFWKWHNSNSSPTDKC